MACELCKDPWELYFSHKYVELAQNYELHSFLMKCEKCGDLYHVVPEDRKPPRRLTVEEARELYPGAL